MDYWPKIVIFQILVENIQVIYTISCQRICASFLLLNVPLFVEFYILIPTVRVNIRREWNVVSCLFENFRDVGYFFGPWMRELTIFEYNCVGKHKNSIVIWFIIWIIKTIDFPNVTQMYSDKEYSEVGER